MRVDLTLEEVEEALCDAACRKAKVHGMMRQRVIIHGSWVMTGHEIGGPLVSVDIERIQLSAGGDA